MNVLGWRSHGASDTAAGVGFAALYKAAYMGAGKQGPIRNWVRRTWLVSQWVLEAAENVPGFLSTMIGMVRGIVQELLR